MAYNNKVQTEVLSIKKNMSGDYINVTAIVYDKCACHVDVRQYYTDESGEKIPTKKGVRFSDEIAAEIAAAIIRCTEDVEGTLDAVADFVHQTAGEDDK